MAQGRAGAVDDRDDGFAFAGDALALDLVNTEVVVRGKRCDLLATPHDLARWWRAVLWRYGDDPLVAGADAVLPTAAQVAATVELRASLRGIFTALAGGLAPEPSDLARLNAVLSTGYQSLEVAPPGRMQLVCRPREPALAALLPIALSAARLATSVERGRLHRCENERCILLFYDTTKSATRRWCSVGCKDRDRKLTAYHRATDAV